MRRRSVIGDRRGASAVEFAIIAPVFALLFAGTLDIGAVLLKRFQLDNTLSAAANYALVSQANVSSAKGAALATALASIVSGSGTTQYADSAVVVNDGPSQKVVLGVALAPSGTASNADQCYCPTATPTLVWGSPVTCGNACPSGLRAGKFVQIQASRAHTPLFSGYGIVKSGTVSVSTLVQTG
ncbi:pilus assembly protein [Polymorphobacter sp. PAMC 29334]|uniref:TadE/TadG family type IV pilus assembly protein n=1 Tax=Polymorphobacter sp. PAMC 29334 TaxID=2862331 RepID=UPI001C68149E|nr:TadE/TadG family type IV pilus assembly protein [Polymorphobacter sp. PAMC 29334]QYE36590.1 pilus assembly protein [Polymorphobacter sp. PAMC 29334]